MKIMYNLEISVPFPFQVAVTHDPPQKDPPYSIRKKIPFFQTQTFQPSPFYQWRSINGKSPSRISKNDRISSASHFYADYYSKHLRVDGIPRQPSSSHLRCQIKHDVHFSLYKQLDFGQPQKLLIFFTILTLKVA